MKNKIQIFALCFLLSVSANVSKAFAVGIAVGTKMNVTKDFEGTSFRDHFFVGGDVFANYYDHDDIDHNYGAKASFGYNFYNAEVFGLVGAQHAEFEKGASFSQNNSALYGFGIGYDFTDHINLRLSRTYFTLERDNGSDKDFGFTDVVLTFLL